MPHFGGLEAEVMDQVWAAGTPVCVRDVLAQITRRRPLAYTTVQTVMDILYRKGWLSRVKEGRVNLYAATKTRQDYVTGLLDEALAGTDDRPAVLLRFVERMDPAEARAFRSALHATGPSPRE